MCHSSERRTFWSRRQHGTPEAMERDREAPRRDDEIGRGAEPAADPGEDGQVRRERELERIS